MSSSSPPDKIKPHAVARHYKPVLTDPTNGIREVHLFSTLVAGQFIELVSAEDRRTGDDAYIQGVREELHGNPPFNGAYARQMGLIHICSRRISHDDGHVLKRHTNPMKDQWGQPKLDPDGREMFYPRQYMVRLVPEGEQEKSGEERLKHRKKVLNTIAMILHKHDEASRKGRPSSTLAGGRALRGSPGRRGFSATKVSVPEGEWDRTPEPLLPLDCYLTDQMIETVIRSVYVESDIGAWRMFSENVPEAHCFFSPPYSYIASTYGFRNPDESSFRERVPPSRVVEEEDVPVEQGFDTADVLPLDKGEDA